MKCGNGEILTKQNFPEAWPWSQEETMAREAQGIEGGAWPNVFVQRSQIHKYYLQVHKNNVTSFFNN